MVTLTRHSQPWWQLINSLSLAVRSYFGEKTRPIWCMNASEMGFLPSAESKEAEKDLNNFIHQSIETHYRSIYQYALSLTKSEADAADITQDAMIAFLKKAGEIRDQERVKSWLYKTVYRKFLKHAKRRDRHEEFNELTPEHAPLSPPPQLGHLDSSAVMLGLQALQEPHRAVLALFYLEDLSYKEIASTLDLPIGTVMSRISRAKDLLRHSLSA